MLYCDIHCTFNMRWLFYDDSFYEFICQNWILNEVTKRGNNIKWWVGLRKEENRWTWHDGQPFNSRNA